MPRFAKAFLYLIYLVLIAGFVAAIILSFSSSKPKPPASPPASSKTKSTHQSTPPPATSSQGSPDSATSKSSTASLPATLGNTGPGDVIGVFLASTVVGTLGSRYLLFRLKEDK